MPEKMNVDKDMLYNMIKEGKTSKEIQEKIGFSTNQQLKAHVLDLSIEKNELLRINSSRGRRAGNRIFTKVGIHIPKSMIEAKFHEGDEFEYVHTRKGN